MAILPLTNVINISVSAAQTGIGAYSVNNLALFTNDAPGSSFGLLGYSIYLSPQQVGVDFGTSSETFDMANAVFSQQPNILNGGGYLTVIPFVPGSQTLAFSGVAASGSFQLISGGSSIIITATESASAIQGAIQAGLPGLSQVKVSGSIASELLTLTYYGVYGAPPALTIGTNTLETSGSASITVTPAVTGSGETLAAAISRTQGLVQYFGIMNNSVLGSSDILAAAAVVQPLNNILFVAGDDASDLSMGGKLQLITAAGFTHTRAIYYGGDVAADVLNFMASYAGLALSTNFNGSNTTQTMHLKNLAGVIADGSLTQTLLNEAVAAGADTYPSLQGVAKVFTSGANNFYDQVYNLGWYVGALQVAGFNYLAESSTKVPQTEQGMTGLKGAYRAVSQQAVVNQYVAPGSWTSSTTFGNQVDFLNNVASFGYYIYSQPVSQQNPVNREARQAPLVQIAIKAAGAIQSSDVIVYVNQ